MIIKLPLAFLRLCQNSNYTFVLLLALLIACSSEPQPKQDKILNFQMALDQLPQNPLLQQSKQCIIVPGEGCSGCISNATGYLIEHYEEMKDSTYIIFTAIQDKKTLRVKIGNTFFTMPNVYLDTDNAFLKADKMLVKPIILELSNGKITTMKEFSPPVYIKNNE